MSLFCKTIKLNIPPWFRSRCAMHSRSKQLVSVETNMQWSKWHEGLGTSLTHRRSLRLGHQRVGVIFCRCGRKIAQRCTSAYKFRNQNQNQIYLFDLILLIYYYYYIIMINLFDTIQYNRPTIYWIAATNVHAVP